VSLQCDSCHFRNHPADRGTNLLPDPRASKRPNGEHTAEMMMPAAKEELEEMQEKFS